MYRFTSVDGNGGSIGNLRRQLLLLLHDLCPFVCLSVCLGTRLTDDAAAMCK